MFSLVDLDVIVYNFNEFISRIFSAQTLQQAFSFFFEYVVSFLVGCFIILVVGRFLEESIESEKQKRQYDKRALDVLGIRVNRRTIKKNFASEIFTKKSSVEDKFLQDVFSESNKRRIEELKKTLKRTGLKINLDHFFMASGVLGVVVFGIFFKMKLMHPLILLVVALVSGIYLAKMLFEAIADSRVNRIRSRFPEALDMINRSLKTGFDTERSILLVSKAGFGELSDEFGEIYRRISIGIPVTKATYDAIENIPIEEFKFFTVALSVHSEAGGNLIELISNLSSVVRKRQEVEMKINTLSSESRMTAKILSTMPLALVGIFYAMNPKHFDPFFEPGTGKTLLLGSIVSYITGLIIIRSVSTIKV